MNDKREAIMHGLKYRLLVICRNYSINKEIHRFDLILNVSHLISRQLCVACTGYPCAFSADRDAAEIKKVIERRKINDALLK